MLRVRTDARLEASDETTYARSEAAWTTRARVLSETGPLPLSARETVAVETPARRATSSMPGIPPPGLAVGGRAATAGAENVTGHRGSIASAVEAFAPRGRWRSGGRRLLAPRPSGWGGRALAGA